jgi:hypothetical protein
MLTRPQHWLLLGQQFPAAPSCCNACSCILPLPLLHNVGMMLSAHLLLVWAMALACSAAGPLFRPTIQCLLHVLLQLLCIEATGADRPA